MNRKLLFSLLLLCGMQYMAGQDAITSIKVNLCHVMLSPDAKTISYDVYLQGVNKDTVVAVPGFLFRLSVPQSDIGTSKKKLSVTNASDQLGCCADTIIPYGMDWLMKFINGNMIVSYSKALVASKTYPGTLIGNVRLSNDNGTPFSDPITIHLNYSGTGPKTKTTCSVFIPNETVLAPNSTASQPAANFSGLGTYTLSASGKTTFVNIQGISENDPFTVNGPQVMRVFDLNGRTVLSKTINDHTDITLSSLPSGIYIVDVNGIQKKLVKR